MANRYADEFSESRFLKKAQRVAKVAGREVLEKGLWLYYAFPSAPPWARGTILGALGYFISPLDAIPDVVPVAGYTDDLAVIVAAVAVLGTRIDDDVRAKATERLRAWGLVEEEC
jgi:uncharacterized membrane protein YkvA (DUF1232 family)